MARVVIGWEFDENSISEAAMRCGDQSIEQCIHRLLSGNQVELKNRKVCISILCVYMIQVINFVVGFIHRCSFCECISV